MSRLTISVGLIFALGLATAAFRPAVSSVPTCRSADEASAYVEALLQKIVSDSRHGSVTVRTALQLPQMNPSQVSLVTEAQICSKAAAGLDTAQDSVNANRIMYVFKLGDTRFGVFEVVKSTPSANFASGFDTIWYFTNKWVFLSAGLF